MGFIFENGFTSKVTGENAIIDKIIIEQIRSLVRTKVMQKY